MSAAAGTPVGGGQRDEHAECADGQDAARHDAKLGDKLASVVGGRTAAAMHKAFGMSTVGDLLGHYPRRYAKRGELTVLGRLPLGEDVTIVAEVLDVSIHEMRTKKGTIFTARITDGKGILTLTFFNQEWRKKQLLPGVRGIFAGKVSDFKGTMQLTHPAYELFDDPSAEPIAKEWVEAPIPIYPATASIASWQIQKIVKVALERLGDVPDPVPDEIRAERRLVPFSKALRRIHRPKTDADAHVAGMSLRFQEAFVLQAALLQLRASARSQHAVPRAPAPGGYLERFDAALAFTLTGDQQKAGAEIAADLAQSAPMSRLIQGEVGSGKTVVALRAMLAVADSGGQAALLAPTEVLAGQHLRSIVGILGPDLAAELVPTLITGQLPTAIRKKALLRTVSGQARIVVGTHALISDSVEFFDLGLVVVDEQHRFGVDQREALRLKGSTPPHVLVLTATPIPRTVAMTVFGDLDVSTIAELPADRKGIESIVVPLAEKPGWAGRIWPRIAEEVAAGHQVYLVCPAITPKETEGVDATTVEGAHAIATVETMLRAARAHRLLASARIEELHGRMSTESKEATMRSFAAGDIDVLVATTVIEVGVDVVNASAMVVCDADRFGVSQLHQLRGRVGRGGLRGLCLFVTHAEEGSLARQRVDAVAATLDGFKLAQVDLELRQEGNVLGVSQSGGRSSLRLLRVVRDGDLITEARQLAASVLDADPALAAHAALSEAITRRLDDAERDFLAKN